MAVETSPSGKPMIFSDENGDYAVCLGYINEDERKLYCDHKPDWTRRVRCGGHISVSPLIEINSDSWCVDCKTTSTEVPAEPPEIAKCSYKGCDGTIVGGKEGRVIAHSQRCTMYGCRNDHVSFRDHAAP